MKIVHSLLSLLFVIGLATSALATLDNGGASLGDPYGSDYVIAQDTIPLNERYGDYINNSTTNPFDLNDPSIIEKEIEYDPVTGNYIILEKIGDDYYRMPTYMTFEEYLDYRAQEQEQAYFNKLSGVSTENKGEGGQEDPIAKFENDIKSTLIDRLFGGSDVKIDPKGNIELTFGADFQRIQNPVLTIRQQRQGGFDFDMNIQMNVTGKIGEKLNLSTSYNTQATFDFENKMKLNYDSDAFSEDEIIKNIDVGNISFPLKNSLIQGSSNLFGVRIDSKWGRLSLSTVASQQKSRRERLELKGGSQLQEFEVRADQYDENRHFFLSHFNRETFEEALGNLPQVRSLFKINPQEIQVWITNDRNATEGVREIVAIADLGEPDGDKMTNTNPNLQPPMIPRFRDITGQIGLPDNRANPIYGLVSTNENARGLETSIATLTGATSFQMKQAQDLEKVTARLLSPSEYTYHPELGFISMNTPVQPDQVLAVAYQYDYNGQVYKVGEFGNDNYDSTAVLFVKMLKSTTQRINLPTWDLMMKNVYSLGAYQVDQNDFLLDIYYEDPKQGEIRFLPESNLQGLPLLRVFNLDRLNVQGDPCPDGIFDFVPGITIQPRNGRIMFPVLEPFGNDLVESFDNMTPQDSAIINKYNYFHLYDSTITRAREHQNLNRYIIKGTYKSGSGGGGGNEISLGAFNLPRGSVRVTAGGQTLQEGADYEVDYSTGRVTIFNEAYINSDIPVNVSFEDNTLFGFQTRTLLGTRADYEVSENFNIGATWMHLFERPFTQKVNIGDDPINNSVYGLDINYSKDAPWLTKAVDRIPFIDTKEPSSIAFQAEAAMLRPGHAKAINQDENGDGNDNGGGVVYVDDFEGATSSIDLRTPVNRWVLASVPQGGAFPEADSINQTLSGVNRAKLSWYRIDLSVANNLSDPYQAPIPQTEVFPNTSIQPGQSNTIQTFDLTYTPDERGPYNFDLPASMGGTEFSAGISESGRLEDPESRWGGIMRALNTNDFQAANIEYIEFWMLDPMLNGRNDGELNINLGNISEDILRDSRKFFENGLPTTSRNAETDVTEWSRVPVSQSIVNAFANTGDVDREMQDVGLDGFDNDGERSHFSDILQLYQSTMNSNSFAAINADPSNDDFVYFRDPSVENEDVFRKYARFNNPEGNSQTPGATGQLQSGTNLPDSEDINRDNTLSETEAYFEYKIPLKAGIDGNLDYNNTPFVTDSIHGPSNGGVPRIWYRFKVPLTQATSKIGGIEDFRSIRFMRMYVNGFRQRTTLRFARLELARNQWRRYQLRLDSANCIDVPPGGAVPTLFDLNAVNVEQNSNRTPFNYVLPPGVRREQANNTAFPDLLQNEQSLAIEVCNLCESFAGKRGGTRAVYKTVNMDMRLYKRLKMFVHAEPLMNSGDLDLQDGDLSIFLRLGSDFQNNYYEYEIPLTLSDPSVSPMTDNYAREVWRIENDFDISLDALKEIKLQRNDEGRPFDEVYDRPDPDDPTDRRRIRIKGNPHMGPLKSIMIGVVNRDDQPHCAEIWVNEMRLSGLDERGGIAATARMDMKLADFGTFTTAVEYKGIGYGGIEERLAQRSREELIQIDASSSLELGKFLPEDSGVKIPMYVQYSKTIRNPEYDPYDKDITLEKKLDRTTNGAARDSIKKQAQDVTELKSINFTNVRKERTNTDKTPMPWNIENFSVSYSLTETNRRNPFIESDNIKVHNGSLDYSYSRGGSFITPFKNLFKKDKYLKLITEFNFNPLPNSFGFSTSMNREYQVTKYRFTDLDPRFNTFYNKQFTWDRTYDLKWDFTKALKFNFSAFNSAVIDELKELDENGQARPQEALKKEIWDNIKIGGRTKIYNHNLNLSYAVPFKNIPFMDWVQVRAQYGADYSWTAAAINVDSLGNVIQNSQTRQINGDLNFENLYKKSKYLDKISRGKRQQPKGRSNNRNRGRDGASKGSTDSSKSRGGDQKGGKSGGADDGGKDLSKLDPSKEQSTIQGAGGKDGKGNVAGTGGKATDSKGKRRGAKKNKKKKDREPSTVERILIRPFLLLRKARLSYAENYATVIPGYMPQTNYLGSTDNFGAPGLDFIAGLQPNIAGTDGQNDWLDAAEQKGWISTSVFHNQQVLQDYSQDITARLTLEPFKDFKIELSADRRKSENSSVYFRDTSYLDGTSDLIHSIPRDVGSFSISYFAMKTLFNDDLAGLFDEFEANRNIISARLGGTNVVHGRDSGFVEGYGRVQQDVLLPAFIAAYSGQDANTMELDGNNNYLNVLLKTIPKINWQVTYDGLSKLPWFKEHFQSFSVSHGYKSNLTVNSFNTEQFFDATQPRLLDNNQNFYSRFEVPNVVISEQFSPLFGIDAKLKNDLSLRGEFSKSRNLAMSFMDYRLAETKSTEYLVSVGYTMKDVVFGFLQQGAKKKKKSKKKKDDDKNDPKNKGKKKDKGGDLTFDFDFSYSNNITYNHTLDQNSTEPTRGSKDITISPSVDYDVNERLNIRLFFERRQTIPATSASFPITNTRGGVTVTFSIN